MAKMYGGRYENLNRPVGGGGQGTVLRVRDIQDPAKPEYALKRLKDDQRCARFKSEIEALQTIEHPNVVRIIAHSGDPAPGAPSHKYWFVMPLATGNLQDRVGLYQGNLDGVLQVAIQLADALAAAHEKHIVHRDVKPANILFPRLDHHVWLSDFGICHLGTGRDRLTETGEIVGPRAFIAPELEAGGQVTVTPAADLYSLGKVIYYMLSGGRIVAREQIDTPDYVAAFEKGERYQLLRTLLSRMIVARLDRRVSRASDVRDELRRIEQWEEHARSFALRRDVLASIDLAQNKAIDRARIRAENEEALKSHQNLVELVSSSILAWLQGELQKLAALLESRETHKTEIGKATWNDRHHFGFCSGPGEDYVEVDGLQIAFSDTTAIFKTKFVLKFFVCRRMRMQIQIGNDVKAIKTDDPRMAVIPYVTQLDREDSDTWHLGGFLKSAAALARSHAEYRTRMGNRYPLGNDPLIARTFIGAPINLLAEFKASEWPDVLDRLKELFSEAVKITVEFSTTDNRSTGP